MQFTTLVLATLATLAASRTSWSELESYSFDKFVTEFGHPWKAGSPEWMEREAIFSKELARVRAHNLDATKSWKEGINQFSAMSSKEMNEYRGRSKGADFHHKPKFAKSLPSDFVMKPVSSLPKAVDWRAHNIVSAVKDQGHCGSCWGFAATATVESHVAKATGLLWDLSVQQLTMCAPNPDHCGGTGKCQGSTAELAFDYLAGSSGFYQEYQQGYAAYGGSNSDCTVPDGTPKIAIDGYVELPQNNYTAIMNAIATVGPVAINVDANFGAYESGIFNGCDTTKNVDINHVVVLVGYGEDKGNKYWFVRNSWSPSWGEGGYIRVARSDNDDTNCGVDSTPQDGIECIGSDEPIKVCGTCGIIYDGSYPTGARSCVGKGCTVV